MAGHDAFLGKNRPCDVAIPYRTHGKTVVEFVPRETPWDTVSAFLWNGVNGICFPLWKYVFEPQ